MPCLVCFCGWDVAHLMFLCWQVIIIIAMFLAQSQFKAHVCSEKMKCLIGDCLKNGKSVLLSSDARYLLQNTSKYAHLYLFNPNFTSIAQSFKISAVDSLECTCFIKRQNSFSFIYTSKDVLHAFNLRKGEDEDSKEEISVRANLQNDSFKILSPAIALSERDEAVVAYTQQDQFHLLLVEVIDRKRTLRCLKLNDLNRPTGLISWITRQKPPHFDNVKLLPFLAIDANNFRVLCVRDNSAAVFSISFNNEEGTIKQVFICNTFSKAISRDDLLLNMLVLSQSEVLLLYSAKERLLLVKMKIANDESSLTIDSFKTNMPVSCIKALASRDNLYLSIYDENNYKCFRSPLSDLEALTKDYKALEPLLQSKDPIDFTSNSKEFFMISHYSIRIMEDDCIANRNIPSQDAKIQSYEGWVGRTYSTRMKKMVQQGSYQELLQACVEKEEKLIEQYRQADRREAKNETVKQKLAELIICTYVVRQIIANNRHFEQLLQNIEYPKISSELREANCANLLEETLIEQTPALINHLVRLILRMDMYVYLNTILEEITKHSLKDDCRSTLNSIFSKLCETAIQSFPQSQSYSLSQYKQLLQNTLSSIDVKEGCFVQQLLFLAESQDNWTFLRNMVLNYKMIECFKHLFLRTEMEFQANNVKEMVCSLEQSARQQYLLGFFGELKRAYDKKQGKRTVKVDLRQKCAVLMQGLADFQQQIEGILRSTFPGLRAYFYLNKNSSHYSQQINTIASQCKDPKVAYLLFLSTLNERDQNQLQNLDHLRSQCQQSSIVASRSTLIHQSLSV